MHVDACNDVKILLWKKERLIKVTYFHVTAKRRIPLWNSVWLDSETDPLVQENYFIEITVRLKKEKKSGLYFLLIRRRESCNNRLRVLSHLPIF